MISLVGQLLLYFLMLCYVVLARQHANTDHANTDQLHNGCPHPCHCDWKLDAVYCVNASLTTVPMAISPQVKFLYLHGNRISQISNETFQQFRQLIELDLSSNTMENISDDAFVHLSHLRMLNLRQNLLKDNVLQSIGHLRSLTWLDLAGNQISDINSIDLVNLTKLTSVDLSHNRVQSIDPGFISHLPNLQTVDISWNELDTLSVETVANQNHALRMLNVSHNNLNVLPSQCFVQFYNLTILDISYNQLVVLDVDWFTSLVSLTHLMLGGNRFNHIPNNAFTSAVALQSLDLSSLVNLTHLYEHSLAGLVNLIDLNLSHNPQLEFIHANAFHDLASLMVLDLSYCDLSYLHQGAFVNLTNLDSLHLYGNPWMCNCQIIWLQKWLNDNLHRVFLPQQLRCAKPESWVGSGLLNIPQANFTCLSATIVDYTNHTDFKIGSSVVLDCIVEGDPITEVTWITSRKKVFTYHAAFVDHSTGDSHDEYYSGNHTWHDSKIYIDKSHPEDRIRVLKNGSLYIDYVIRSDGGPYKCKAVNAYGNDTVTIKLMLNYDVIYTVMINSLIVGFATAVGFLLLGILIGSIRYLVIRSNRNRTEIQKGKGIREILDSLHEYKAEKFAHLSAYKTAKMDQFSAYRTAKIDKLRTYKQVTMTSIFQYMERMREHYTLQTSKIKDNCSQQVETLREKYSTQVDRFKGYRTHQVEKVRENYNFQLFKIRDYGSQQMEKLREQYKTQHLHLMKLIEILDIGNCMTVIEAECMRTESMLFDPNIDFDLEAQPVHQLRGLDSDTNSDPDDYLTAGSDADISSVSHSNFTVEDEITSALDHKTSKKRIHEKSRGASRSRHSKCEESDTELDNKTVTRVKHKRKKKKPDRAADKDSDNSVQRGTDTVAREGDNARHSRPDKIRYRVASGDKKPDNARELTPGMTSVATSDDYVSCNDTALQSRDSSPETSDVSVTSPHSRSAEYVHLSKLSSRPTDDSSSRPATADQSGKP